MFTYFFIFIAKVLENSIATLRLIVVANGRKLIGAFLNLTMSTIWVITTGMVVTNIKEDPLKILFFVLGCFTGSYIGSYMEEKIAIGSNMLLIITKPNFSNIIKEKLKTLDYPCYILNDNEYDLLFVLVERKNRSQVLKIMKEIDEDIIIISESARKLLLNKIK